MTFTRPTAADIIAVYPAFTGSEPQIDMALMEASFVIDDSWGDLCDTEEEGQKLINLAFNLYTAHVLTLEGIGAEGNVEAELARSGMTGFETMRSGELSVTRKSGGSGGDSSSSGPLSLTLYGKRFIELRGKFFGGPRVTNVTDYNLDGPNFNVFPF